MQLGFFMNTHGLGIRDDDDWWLQPIPAEEMVPLEIARIGEEGGFHSLWFSDHVAMPPQSVPIAYANPASGKRHYPARPVMMDGAAVMGAVAATTQRIKMAPSVLIAPYRPPMHDARQFSTIDHLSNGRLIMGVGAGWCREEFDGLGLRFEDRVAMTEECIEIYKRAWDHEGELVTFKGKHYSFENLSMDPKPVQRPHPPIIYGGTTPLGARVAARSCDGLYPMFPSPRAQPQDKDDLLEIIRREADQNGRGPLPIRATRQRLRPRHRRGRPPLHQEPAPYLRRHAGSGALRPGALCRSRLLPDGAPPRLPLAQRWRAQGAAAPRGRGDPPHSRDLPAEGRVAQGSLARVGRVIRSGGGRRLHDLLADVIGHGIVPLKG